MARAKKPKRTLPAKPSRWESASLGNKLAFVGLIVTFVLTVLGFLQNHFLGNPSRKKDSRELESLKTQSQPSPDPDPGCGFPAHFVRDTLYVLITRFEDTPIGGAGKPYGKGIEGRIDILSDSLKLPIRFCYRDDLPPNQRRDANALRDKFHADLVIWGKLKNASSQGNADGFNLQFEPSDTLITYAGGKITKPKLDYYQSGISAGDMEIELIWMGNEVFEDFGLWTVFLGSPKKFIRPYEEKVFKLTLPHVRGQKQRIDELR
ncbi:MAG: hypothetical protein ACKVUS_22115, partial [Saprospiraceae bacterium]